MLRLLRLSFTAESRLCRSNQLQLSCRGMFEIYDTVASLQICDHQLGKYGGLYGKTGNCHGREHRKRWSSSAMLLLITTANKHNDLDKSFLSIAAMAPYVYQVRLPDA